MFSSRLSPSLPRGLVSSSSSSKSIKHFNPLPTINKHHNYHHHHISSLSPLSLFLSSSSLRSFSSSSPPLPRPLHSLPFSSPSPSLSNLHSKSNYPSLSSSPFLPNPLSFSLSSLLSTPSPSSISRFYSSFSSLSPSTLSSLSAFLSSPSALRSFSSFYSQFHSHIHSYPSPSPSPSSSFSSFIPSVISWFSGLKNAAKGSQKSSPSTSSSTPSQTPTPSPSSSSTPPPPSTPSDTESTSSSSSSSTPSTPTPPPTPPPKFTFDDFFDQENLKTILKNINSELNDKGKSDKKPNAFKEQKNKNKKENKDSDEDEDSKMPKFGPLGLFFVVVSTYFLFRVLSDATTGKSEITFVEFKNNYLARGVVESLKVSTNDKIVTVKLKGNSNNMNNNNNNMNNSANGNGNGNGFSSMNSDPSASSSQSLYFTIGSVESFEVALEEAQRDLDISPSDFIPVKYSVTAGLGWIVDVLQIALVIAILVGMRSSMSALTNLGGKGGKGGGPGGIFSIGKSNATVIKPGEGTAPKTTFADVAGLDEAKVEVMEFVQFLKSPQQFTRLGAKIPKGALLCGPPGTGKTLLARAIAGEASVPFFSISGSDFIEMFVGVGPSRVRDLFAQARLSAPCIIWIDEIDAVGRSRSKGGFNGGNDERENTLNQLLVEMDGFTSSEGVVVLAGTNRKDILDKALLRPGRFDRHISIDKPDIKGREQIFKVHLKIIKLAGTIDEIAPKLAALTPGLAGADIANLVNEAAILAARTKKDAVELIDFEKATDRILAGLENHRSTISPLEKKLIAFHEAGHAVVGWFLEYADPLLKVTIVPRSSGALGFAQYLPKEIALYNASQLEDMMCVSLGGRASEQIFFGKVSTGAQDDLKKVTRIAQSQVTMFGMSSLLGNVSYDEDSSERQFTKPYSEATAQKIDDEVRRIITTAYERSLEMVQNHKELIAKLAEKLIEKETLNHDSLIEILGPRPFQSDSYTQYVKASESAAVEENKRKKEKDDAASTASASTPPPIPTPTPV